MPMLPASDRPSDIRDYVEGIYERTSILSDEAFEDRARAKRRDTLEDLEAELYFVSRASRMVAMPAGSDEFDPVTDLYRELLPKLLKYGELPTMVEKHAIVLRAAYRENVRNDVFSKAWGKKSPRTWLASLKADEKDLPLPAAEQFPAEILSRDALRRQLWNTTDPVRSALLVLAWGEMRADHARELFGTEGSKWLDLIARLRLPDLTREDAYREFCKLQENKQIPGLGPAYFTKLIYFLRYVDQNETGVGYIMDQWTATSVNLLFGTEIVKMSRADKTKTGTYVSSKNTPQDYELFNRLIEHIASEWRTTAEHVEMTLFGRGGKGSDDLWRRHVVASLPPK